MMELACETRSVDVLVEAGLDDGLLGENLAVVLLERSELVVELENDVLFLVVLEEVVGFEEALECTEGLVLS